MENSCVDKCVYVFRFVWDMYGVFGVLEKWLGGSVLSGFWGFVCDCLNQDGQDFRIRRIYSL
jgi:hypothetical protein